MKSQFIKTFKQLHEVLPKHKKVYESFSHRMPHYAYPQSEAEKIQYKHIAPLSFKDKVACIAIKFIRKSYDYLTGYNPNDMTERKWITRCMFLETVAGVPGMVGGMCRHLRSLRTMKRDNGWIHHLIE
jgi:threonyl-tRNA synthetase